MNELKEKRVAVLITDGSDENHWSTAKDALKEAGALVEVVSERSGSVITWRKGNWGSVVSVGRTLRSASEPEYDALLIPGGILGVDKLRGNKDAVAFVRAFFQAHKPVATIGHGPWLLVEAGVVHQRNLTSHRTLRTDIENAKGRWTDEDVVVDEGLVTGRSSDDLPTFNRKLVEEIWEGKHSGQSVQGHDR